MPLTDTAIRSAKPTEKPQKLADGSSTDSTAKKKGWPSASIPT